MTALNKDYVCNGYFTVCAVTPGGELYQLESFHKANPGKRRPGYGVCLIDRDGGISPCICKGYPEPATDLAEAISRFERWANAKGYEVMKNEFINFNFYRGGNREVA